MMEEDVSGGNREEGQASVLLISRHKQSGGQVCVEEDDDRLEPAGRTCSRTPCQPRTWSQKLAVCTSSSPWLHPGGEGGPSSNPNSQNQSARMQFQQMGRNGSERRLNRHQGSAPGRQALPDLGPLGLPDGLVALPNDMN